MIALAEWLQVEECHYRAGRSVAGARPGHHRASRAGAGVEFHGHTALHRGGDPRRLDLLASISNPLRELVARTQRQRAALPVQILADLSRSMAFVGNADKQRALTTFTASLGYSAYRTGDPFGFIGCDTEVLTDLLLPPTGARGAALALAQRLAHYPLGGRGATGLLDGAALLGRRRALVFLVSDFYFALDFTARLLRALGRHQVVPVVVRDSAEFERLPPPGIARLRDLESGRQRTLWLRPSLIDRARERARAERQDLGGLLGRHGLAPLWMIDGFEADRVTRYFFG